MPNVAKSATPGRLRVLFIDLTRNDHGFEHALSAEIFQKLASGGVDLATKSPLLLKSNEEIADRLKDPNLQFNTLFLVAHGCPDPGDGTASEVIAPDGKSHWYYLSGLLPNLRDKTVCLAVCYGSCVDAVEALTKGEMFALTLVAPKSGLSASEALAFYPTFLEELNRSFAPSIEYPNLVQRCVDNNNHLANRKMRVYSAAKSGK